MQSVFAQGNARKNGIEGGDMPRTSNSRTGFAALTTTDFFVPHISIVSANAGQMVGLHVRQKTAARKRPASAQPVVLLVHGGSSPAVPVFDLDYKDYSWMNHLAAAGCNVFAMDLTGYGSSPRPMMDDPCNVGANQQSIVIPRPLSEPRKPHYPHELVTIRNNWDEIDSVVDYIRRLCRVKRVNILGWSAGCARVGGYAAQHPEKIRRVVLFAGGKPIPGLVIPDRPGPGAPIKLQTRTLLEKERWDPDVRSPGQVEPGMRDIVWKQTMQWDRIGAAWGPPEGVMRIPHRTDFGWTEDLAKRLAAPTLIMTGAYDKPDQRLAAYRAIGPKQKIFLKIAGGSHFIQWEKQHRVLFASSLEWFAKGSLQGKRHGQLSVDEEGQFEIEEA